MRFRCGFQNHFRHQRRQKEAFPLSANFEVIFRCLADQSICRGDFLDFQLNFRFGRKNRMSPVVPDKYIPVLAVQALNVLFLNEFTNIRFAMSTPHLDISVTSTQGSILSSLQNTSVRQINP